MEISIEISPLKYSNDVLKPLSEGAEVLAADNDMESSDLSFSENKEQDEHEYQIG